MRKAIFSLTGVGALLLLISQFLPLYSTYVTSLRASVASGSVGGDHSYGVLPLALLALVLGYGVWTLGSRLALSLIGVLGIAALVIGLGHDLPNARGHGLRMVAGHYEMARNVVAVGLYVELFGALVLLMAAVAGFLLGGVVTPGAAVPAAAVPGSEAAAGVGGSSSRKPTPPQR